MASASENQLYLPALAEYRRLAAKRRAEAFVPGLDNVCGIPCNPITPQSFTMLLALGSRFVCGGGQPGEGDIRNYLWIHSPEFEPGNSWRIRRKRERVVSKFTALGRKAWLRVFRAPDIHTYVAAMAFAINDIARLVEDALADAPASSGIGQKPARATLEAQMIDIFAQAYQWTPKRTRTTPLRQLYQLIRLINADHNPDAREAEIIGAHLLALNPGGTGTTTAACPGQTTNGVAHA